MSREPGPRRPVGGEGIARQERLRRRADFQRCYRRGRRRGGAHVVVYFVPNELSHPRFGLTVSRKVGKAVVRQRVKRRLREAFRRWEGREALPALDLVLHAHRSAGSATWAEIEADVGRLLGDVARRGR